MVELCRVISFSFDKMLNCVLNMSKLFIMFSFIFMYGQHSIFICIYMNVYSVRILLPLYRVYPHMKGTLFQPLFEW